MLAPPDQPWRSIAKARQELLSLKLEKFGQLGLEELMHLDRIAYWLNDLEARTLKESAVGALADQSDISHDQP